MVLDDFNLACIAASVEAVLALILSYFLVKHLNKKTREQKQTLR